MATIAHRHRPAKMRDSPFFGCVAPAGQCSPASHGRITRVQTCTCGATRRVNSDGLYAEERGPWTMEGQTTSPVVIVADFQGCAHADTFGEVDALTLDQAWGLIDAALSAFERRGGRGSR